MRRNIKLLKITSALNNSWFWLGIWLLYYLRFTDYRGVGIIETVAFANGLIMEIPTGAISDLIGKRKSMIIGNFLTAAGNIVMAFSHSLPMLVLSVFILGPGYGLISGTKEALLYDSLKQINKTKENEKQLSYIHKYQLVALGSASLVGGILYSLSPGLPFLITGLLKILAGILSFLFEEPKIDTDKFKIKSFLKQNLQGFKTLSTNMFKSRFFVCVIILASFTNLVYQVFDSALAIEFGFTGTQLGTFFAIATFLSALGSHYYMKVKKKTGLKGIYLLLFGTLSLTIVLSPFLGIFLGGSTIMIRELLNKYPEILATDTINKNTPSNVRATTLSTYYMIVGLPYAIFAYFIGNMIDKYTASYTLILILGIYILVNSVAYFSIPQKANNK